MSPVAEALMMAEAATHFVYKIAHTDPLVALFVYAFIFVVLGAVTLACQGLVSKSKE